MGVWRWTKPVVHTVKTDKSQTTARFWSSTIKILGTKALMDTVRVVQTANFISLYVISE